MTRQDSYVEWDRSQWASAATDTRPTADHPRWNKFQWVGDRGQARSVAWRELQDVPNGETGLSGLRHHPGMQHWARREAA